MSNRATSGNSVLFGICVAAFFVVVLIYYNQHAIRYVDVNASCSARFLIDINSADVPTLCLLPGIGIRTAEKIVNLRRQEGEYTCLADLQKVKGIGPKTCSRIASWVITENSSYGGRHEVGD